MRPILVSLSPLFRCAFVTCFCVSQAIAAAVPIFDGKTLEGWESPQPHLWRVEDGAITGGDGNPVKANDFLATRKSYQNFELRLKIKLTGDPRTGMINSGVQIRSQREPNGHVRGYQCDYGEPKWYGGIYDEGRRNKFIAPADMEKLRPVLNPTGWNDYVIRAGGKRIQTWINGVAGVDYTEAEEHIASDGIIAIQIHSGGNAVVQVKDVTIHELPASPDLPTWDSTSRKNSPARSEAAQEALKKPEAPRSAEAPKAPQNKVAEQFSAGSRKSPEEELASFKVAEGFVVELVASERDGVIKPIDLNFDDAGRLWTQTASMYPMDPDPDIKWNDLLRLMDQPGPQRENPKFQRVLDLYQGKTKGTDSILILPEAHKGANGIFSWADGLTIPQSVLPYKDGAFVAQGSELIFLRDSDGDGKADSRESIISGLGYTDSHTMVHLLTRAPGSWVHFSQGALNKGMATMTKSGVQIRLDYSKIGRFSLDGAKLQLVNSGLNNIWGISLRSSGQWYGMEANDQGFSITPMEIGTGYPGIGNEKLSPHQPMFPYGHSFRVGGTGLSGHAFSDDAAGSFPNEWRDVAILANPITNSLNAVRIVRNPDGSVTASHLPDLLTSSDPWFRPVRTTFGPDGCLYVADWYNKIISHNEVARTHPDRDKTRGRIWRVRHISQQPREIVNFYKLANAELPEHLRSASLWAKRAAWHQIADRNANELAPQLVAIAGDSDLDDSTRITSLWCLMDLRHYDEALMTALLKSPRDDVRREAVFVLSAMPISSEKLEALLSGFKSEKVPMVRSQVLRTIADFGKANAGLVRLLVDFCAPGQAAGAKPEILGGAYERQFERYLALTALEMHPVALAAYLDSVPDSAKTEAERTAALALSNESLAKKFLEKWKDVSQKPLDIETFKSLCSLLRHPAVFSAVKPVFEADNAGYLMALALAHRNEVLSPPLGDLLKTACARLLSSSDPREVQQGILAAHRLRIPNQEAAIESILSKHAEAADMLNAGVQVLSRKPGNLEVLHSALQDPRLSSPSAVAAVAALVDQDPAGAEKQAATLAKRLDPIQQRNLSDRLLASVSGSTILLSLLESKALPEAVLDLSSADQLKKRLPEIPGATVFWERKAAEFDAQKVATADRLAKLLKLAGKRGGDPSKGAPFFKTVCLGCHTVGGEGAGFAPALDGSGYRDDEGLLTAILNPDVAIEGGYQLYRILKEDGAVLEGYLSKNELSGATLRFMGGATLFVPAAEILSADYVTGRSMMPRGLIEGLNDSEVEDLLAHIRTLKK